MLTVALVLGFLTIPLAAEAQPAGKISGIGYLSAAQAPSRVARIGYLGSTTAPREPGRPLAAFLEGLRDAGWEDGKNLKIDYRWAAGQVDRLPALAAELVRLRVEVLVAETTPATRAARAATQEIPIVFTSVSDPVGSGFVASLAHPGGNVTGVANILPELTGKLLELVREVVPGASRVAVVWNPGNSAKVLEQRVLAQAAARLATSLRSFEVRKAADLEAAFAAMAREQPDAVVTLADALTVTHARRMAELAVRERLPTVFSYARHADFGGLLAYGARYPPMYRRAGVLVARILDGAPPADLPVEQPREFELVVNLKTAKALGLTIPPSILVRADRVIE